jgi:hypothetical protein
MRNKVEMRLLKHSLSYQISADFLELKRGVLKKLGLINIILTNAQEIRNFLKARCACFFEKTNKIVL